jgi:hypothetical protein
MGLSVVVVDLAVHKCTRLALELGRLIGWQWASRHSPAALRSPKAWARQANSRMLRCSYAQNGYVKGEVPRLGGGQRFRPS